MNKINNDLICPIDGSGITQQSNKFLYFKKCVRFKISYNKIRSGSFSFLKSKEVVSEKNNKIESDEVNDNFNVGESVELDLEPDQLNLFNEKD